MARIGIGIPVYNGESYVGAAIECILNQTFSDFDLIISDNASTDRTEDICRGYAAHDARIRYQRSPVNCGAAWNFNEVFRTSTSEYFKWAAHDDLCAPRFIETCLDALTNHPAAVLAYPQTGIIDGTGAVVSEYFDGFDLRSEDPHDRLLQCLTWSSRCSPVFGVIRASCLATTPLLGSFLANDYILLAQLALRGQFYEVKERLFFAREHRHRATRANRTIREHLVWFDPNNAGGAPVRWLRLLVEYFRSVKDAPLTHRQRRQCYFLMMRWINWHRHSLTAEAIGVLSEKIFRPGRTARPARAH